MQPPYGSHTATTCPRLERVEQRLAPVDPERCAAPVGERDRDFHVARGYR
jgi:hypothetical protein